MTIYSIPSHVKYFVWGGMSSWRFTVWPWKNQPFSWDFCHNQTVVSFINIIFFFCCSCCHEFTFREGCSTGKWIFLWRKAFFKRGNYRRQRRLCHKKPCIRIHTTLSSLSDGTYTSLVETCWRWSSLGVRFVCGSYNYSIQIGIN